MASVKPYRNPSGETVWRVQFREDGRSRQETFRDPGGSKAAHEFAGLVARFGPTAARDVLERRKGHTTGAPTLREFTQRYLDEGSGLLTGITIRTRIDYRRLAKSFLPMLGDLPVDAVSKADVGRWVAWQEAQPARYGVGLVSAKTVKNHHALLSGVLSAAVAEGLRPDNPAHAAKLSKGMRREGVFLTGDEVDTILAFIPERYRPLVVFLTGTGCRWGEATALTWGDFTLTGIVPTVRIERAWKTDGHGGAILGPPKSSRSRRTVSLWPEIVAALPPRGKSNELVFQAPQGGMIWPGRFRTDVWRVALDGATDPEACAVIGREPITKRPRIHDLRHTHASWLVAGGTDLPSVQARLGHESITTTIGTYHHLTPDAHVKMAAVARDAMRGVLPSAQPALEA